LLDLLHKMSRYRGKPELFPGNMITYVTFLDHGFQFYRRMVIFGYLTSNAGNWSRTLVSPRWAAFARKVPRLSL
jgi:hypothetical protein